jgi:hypothetical protein
MFHFILPVVSGEKETRDAMKVLDPWIVHIVTTSIYERLQ